MATLQKITPNLWFNHQAEEAVRYYTSIFKNSKIGKVSYYGKFAPEVKMKEGEVMTVEFELEGQKFLALNGGPEFKFTEAVSLIVYCQNQEELDYYWDKLTTGGDPKSQICGWLKDKYGLSWQVTPTILPDLITGKDREKADRVMKAIMKMKKIDIKTIERAAKESVPA